MKTNSEKLQEIAKRLKTQDNRITENPMFCVQIKVRDVGYDSSFSDNRCWHDSGNEQTVYDDDKDFAGEPEGSEWDEFGYQDRWETVMVALTEDGCKEYLALNGHNDRRRAHNEEVRIYVESFNRCPEMISVRDFLMAGCPPVIPSDDKALFDVATACDFALKAAAQNNPSCHGQGLPSVFCIPIIEQAILAYAAPLRAEVLRLKQDGFELVSLKMDTPTWRRNATR